MESNPAPYRATSLAILGAITVLVTNLVLGLSVLNVGARELDDTDGYMRYARILDLVQRRNGWFDGWIHWSNSPFGHSMHWTRPLDALILLLATPVAPFVGWSDAVYWAALLSGPLLQLSLAGVVMWGAWQMMPPQAAALAGWVAGLQPLITGYSLVGRLDHHLLITVLSLAILGATLASLQSNHRSAAIAGCLSGIALWVSPEALLIIGISAISLAFWWVIRGGPIKILWWWSTAFMSTTFLAMLAESGLANFSSIEFDRISLPYLIVAVGGFIAITTMQVLLQQQPRNQSSKASRFTYLFVLASIAGLTVIAIFPRLLDGPFADTSTRIWDLWLSKVRESQPLWGGDSPFSQTVGNVTTPIIGFICAILLARRRSDKMKIIWVTIAIWLVVLIPLSMSSLRFALYPQALAGIPVAVAAWLAILRWGQGPSIARVLVSGSFICLSVCIYAIAAAFTHSIFDSRPAEAAFELTDCHVGALSDEININLEADGTILAHIDLGPILHVVSGRNVIATPHHRNVNGILDAYDIMRLPLNEARDGIERRGIDGIVICPLIDENYLGPIPQDSLYQRLIDGDLPSWLQEVTVDTPESQLFVIVS
jgi:hypothetical protein